jgi:hypothetical protein
MLPKSPVLDKCCERSSVVEAEETGLCLMDGGSEGDEIWSNFWTAFLRNNDAFRIRVLNEDVDVSIGVVSGGVARAREGIERDGGALGPCSAFRTPCADMDSLRVPLSSDGSGSKGKTAS